MPSISERKRILDDIEQFASKHSAEYPGRLIFCSIDWLSKDIAMLYRACCGEAVQDEHYEIAEAGLKKIYPFSNIRWKRRR